MDSESFIEKLPDSVPDPLQSREALINPFGWYSEKRQNGSIQYDDRRGVYDLLSYRAVEEVLQNAEQFLRPSLADDHGAHSSRDPLVYLDNAMMWSDGTEHKQVKSELFEYFSPARIQELGTTIERVSESETRSLLQGGTEFDFAQDFAEPVSLKITMELLGVPVDDYDRIYRWIVEITEIKRSEYSRAAGDEPVHSKQAVEYIEDIVATRETDPRDDLISVMVNDTGLSDEQVGSNCLDLMVASTKTMSEFLTNAVYLLTDDGSAPDESDHELSETLEEVLRYRSPIQAQLRTVNQTTSIEGTSVEKGEQLVLWFGAANRDPRRYDSPDEFVPSRNPDHLAFGAGPHACIAAPLARFEAPIILRTFLDSFDQLTVLRGAAVPTLSPSSLGFNELPVSTEAND